MNKLRYFFNIISITIFLPSLLLYIGLTNSFSLGVILVIFFLILVTLFKPSQINIGLSNIYLIIFITFHFMVAKFFIDLGDSSRFLLSICYLLLFIIGANIGANKLISYSHIKINNMVIMLSILMIVIVFISFLGYQIPSAVSWNKPIFIFTEPSHFAISFAPIITYGLIANNKYKFVLILIVSCMLFMQDSLTLLVALTLAMLTMANFKKLILVLLFLILIIFLKWDYVANRIMFNDINSLNLSGLVFMQGISFVVDSFKDTYFWGIGFQNTFFLTDLNTEVAELIRLNNGGNDTNASDSGFLAAKILTEFGFFGLLFLIFYLLKVKNSFIYLRNVALNQMEIDYIRVLSNSFIFSSLIEFFFKCNGYFTSTTFLLLISIFIEIKFDKNKRATRLIHRVYSPVGSIESKGYI